MVAEEIAGPTALHGARGDRKADEARAIPIEIAMSGRAGAGLSDRLMKARACNIFLFARGDDIGESSRAQGRGNVNGSLNETLNRPIALRPERRQVLGIHRRETGEALRLFDQGTK